MEQFRDGPQMKDFLAVDETFASKHQVFPASDRISIWGTYLVIALTVGLTFVVDIGLPLGITVAIAYIVPVLLTLRMPTGVAPYATAGICSALVLIGYYISTSGRYEEFAVDNRALVVFAIWATAILVQKEKKHKCAASHLSAIVASSYDAIISVDTNGKITSWNEAAERQYGYLALDAIGKNISFLFESQDPCEFQHLRKMLDDGKLIKNIETTRITKEGLRCHISLSMSVIKDSHQLVIGYSNIERDITDAKVKEEEMRRSAREIRQAKKAAEQANVAKGQFLANVSHEIRTPLAAILGYADRLSKKDLELKDQQKFIGIIQRNGKALLDLINDLLDVTKVDADQLDIDFKLFDLDQFLNEIILLLSQKASEKGIDLDIVYSGKIPLQIFTDRLRLRQIIINLLGNSVKFTKKGYVELKVTYDSNSAILSFVIKDTGTGIKQACRKQLFEPFIQGDASVRREYGGTGLGLHLSKKLASALDGNLYLKTTADGVGSVFVLEIPLGNVDNLKLVDRSFPYLDNGSQDADIFPKTGLEGKRILVVEDVIENLDLIRFYLENAGAQVETATDGELGLEKIMNMEFDIILMDLQMPHLDGYQAIEILRNERKCKLPVVALTAHAMRGEREKCIKAGFDTHVSKPVTAKKIVRVVAEILQKGNFAEINNNGAKVEQQAQILKVEDNFHGMLPPPVEKAIRQFVDHIPDRVEAIEQATEANDKESVEKLIHSFKGCAGTCGFLNLFAELDQLEDQIEKEFSKNKVFSVLNKIKAADRSSYT